MKRRLTTQQQSDTLASVSNDDQLNNSATHLLAIPSKASFHELFQIATKFSDALVPAPISLNGLSAKNREDEIHHLAEHHKDKIRAKLLCRTISQLGRFDFSNDGHQHGWRGTGESAVLEEKEDSTSNTPHNSKKRNSGTNSNRNSFTNQSDSLSSPATLFPPSSGGSSSQNSKLPPRPPTGRHSLSHPSPAQLPPQSNWDASMHSPVPQDNNSRITISHEPNWRSIVLSPNPGFVIKTWKAQDPDFKVFINVFHNEMIDFLLDREDYQLPEDLRPWMAFGDEIFAEDREGKPVPLYQVIIGSSYFMESYITTEKKITDDERVSKVCLLFFTLFPFNFFPLQNPSNRSSTVSMRSSTLVWIPPTL
jgi:hypothetical protein